MKTNARTAMTALLLATMVISPLAEAKRLGGGSSYGMSRTHSSSSSGNSYNSGSTARPYQPAPQYTPQPAPVKKGPGWGGVAAGVAAGAIAGSLLSHSGSANANNSGSNNGANNGTANAGQTQNADGSWSQTPVQQQVQQPVEKKSGFPWFWLILLGGIGYFVYRRFNAKKPALANNASSISPFGAANNTVQPTTGGNTNIFGQPVAGGVSAAPFAAAAAPFTGNGNALPDGTEPAAFLRQARSTFLHMQTMNSSSSVEELRRYFTPEMFTAIQADIAGNTDTAEFPQLNAQIVDSTQENGQYVTSVLYSGTVSEDLNAAPVPFSETWHFVQPIGSTDRKWLVAGIQQG